MEFLIFVSNEANESQRSMENGFTSLDIAAYESWQTLEITKVIENFL